MKAPEVITDPLQTLQRKGVHEYHRWELITALPTTSPPTPLGRTLPHWMISSQSHKAVSATIDKMPLTLMRLRDITPSQSLDSLTSNYHITLPD